MALVKTFDGADLKREFEAWGRDYYSLDACDLVAEGRTPAQNEKITIMCNRCDDLRDLIISHLD